MKTSTWLSAALLALPFFAWAGQAGTVILTNGQVTRMSADGNQHPVNLNDIIQAGDTLITGEQGHLYLRTVDQGFIGLRPNTRVQIEVYDYDSSQPQQTRIRLTLQQGVMRSVSGSGAQAAKHQYRLNTPVAAIGIRGTDFTTVTDQQQTLTSVQQGGIVVAPLGGDCQAGALGPCHAGARELSASDSGSLLQVRQGQVTLLKKAADQPDSLSPPLPQENQKASQPVAKSAPDDSLALAQQVRQSEIIAPSNKPQISQFDWGRWNSLAQLPATTDYSQLAAKGNVVAMNATYALAQLAPASKLPEQGRYGFALQQGEAHFIHDQGGSAEKATISNASLTVDFAQRQFDTSMTLGSATRTTNLTATGSLLPDGRLVSERAPTSPYISPAIVEGALAGAGGGQAAYVFQQRLDAATQVTGVTRWAR